ncbi:APC family permease [soil metagenome]
MHGGERPRSIGPARAAAILYGDWGTSKAYVLGIAFALAGYASFPLLVAMCALTALVGLNYYWVCTFYPDGGGVYSAVRDRSRLIASVGALLLIADYLVTASLSVLEGWHYIQLLLREQFPNASALHIANPAYWAIGLMLLLGVINWYGTRHSGSLAVLLAVPASIAAISIALLAIPHLGEAHIEKNVFTPMENWMHFAGIVLALSGVEAVSNMTGVMRADKKPGPDGRPSVRKTSAITISVVAVEVVVITIILGLAMHAVPEGILDRNRIEAMLGQLATYYGNHTFGPTAGTIYGSVVGLVMAMLLFSAGNTAINGMVSVLYMMSKDREMPSPFGKLNKHGVPKLPLFAAAIMPCLLLLIFDTTERLAGLYAIGVVGAITINLGACSTNKHLLMKLPVRLAMGATALLMLLIWFTVAAEKHDALIFAIVVLMVGLLARSFVQERRQTAEDREFKEMLDTGATPERIEGEALRYLVALRGVTNTLTFALDEARCRGGRLGVLFVREVKTFIPAEEVEPDEEAMKIFGAVRTAAGEVPLDFIYRVSNNVPDTMVQVLRDYRADFLVMGAPSGKGLTTVLRGNMANYIAQNLPDQTQLIIYSWKTAGPQAGVGKDKPKKMAAV